MDANKIAIISIIIAVIIGLLQVVVSIVITRYTIQQGEILSKQEQKIQGFDTLLKNVYGVNSKLTTQLDVLNKQLSLLELTQRESSRIYSQNRKGEMQKLYDASQKIDEYLRENLGYSMMTGYDKAGCVNYLIDALTSELKNIYLLENPDLLNRWAVSLDRLRFYLNVHSGFETPTAASKIPVVNLTPNFDIDAPEFEPFTNAYDITQQTIIQTMRKLEIDLGYTKEWEEMWKRRDKEIEARTKADNKAGGK